MGENLLTRDYNLPLHQSDSCFIPVLFSHHKTIVMTYVSIQSPGSQIHKPYEADTKPTTEQPLKSTNPFYSNDIFSKKGSSKHDTLTSLCLTSIAAQYPVTHQLVEFYTNARPIKKL